MISGLLYDLRREELELLKSEIRNQIALLSDDESRLSECVNDEELSAFLETCRLLDYSCMDVCSGSGAENAARVRKDYPDSSMLVLADMTVPPSRYIRPSIMPSSVIVRPLKKAQVREILAEFMRSFLQNREEDREGGEDIFILKSKDGVTRIPFTHIACFEASMKRVLIRLDYEEFEYYDTLDELEKRLPETFIRCHRGFIVNTSRMKQFNASQSLLVLDNGMQVPVSRSYKGNIRRLIAER